MSQFHREKLDMFLGVVRKYMQVRGGLSQKDLSDLTEVGVSTMSRFLNKKSSDINPQLVAKIVAKLEVPLHEIIDFVDEDYADRFIRLVKFYKSDGDDETLVRKDDVITEKEALEMRGATNSEDELDDIAKALSPNGGSQMKAKGNVSVGGKRRTLVFEPDSDAPHSSNSITDKISSLSGKHKAFMKDFLNLQPAEKDLVVDIGNDLIIYFRHKEVSV